MIITGQNDLPKIFTPKCLENCSMSKTQASSTGHRMGHGLNGWLHQSLWDTFWTHWIWRVLCFVTEETQLCWESGWRRKETPGRSWKESRTKSVSMSFFVPSQTTPGQILISSLLLWKGSSPLRFGGITSEENILIFSKVMVTVQITMGREGCNGDSSNMTLLGSAGYKTALSYSFEG